MFKITHGTIFQGAKIALQKWFLAIVVMVNAKKSLSSHQLARDLGLQQKACWRVMTCIQAEMAKKSVILEGIVEAGETYIGGRNRKDYSREDGQSRKHGRGTAKEYNKEKSKTLSIVWQEAKKAFYETHSSRFAHYGHVISKIRDPQGLHHQLLSSFQASSMDGEEVCP